MAALDLLREQLIPLADLASSFASLDRTLRDNDVGIVMTVTDVSLDLPLEVLVPVDEDGAIGELLTAPPTAKWEASLTPTLHRIRFRLGPHEN